MKLIQRSAAKIQRTATTISLQDNTSGARAKGMALNAASGPEAETEGHASHEMLPLCKDVVISVESMLGNLTPLSTECSIYRVPEKLRKVNKEAYKPRLLSIGPLHHGKKHLVAMEEHKQRYLKKFLSRLDKTLEECVEIISKLERNIRDSYSESIKLSSTVEFLKMILVDGCFIIEVILGTYKGEPNDRIYNKPWLFTDVRRDMTLLENQLPFFLLQSLYNLANPGHENDCSFLAFSIEFFKHYLRNPEIKCPQETNEFAKKISRTYEVKHFVDLLRVCQLPSTLRSSRRDRKFKTAIPTATELHEAGVRFKLGSNDKPLLDIDYRSDGVLEIPKLSLNDNCESLFRNLIAFEQCHYQKDTYITDYIYLMDRLINTTKDVDILVKKGIIDNWLGDNVAVTNLFNNLLIDATLWSDNFYFAGIFESLKEYYDVTWHSWKATLRHDYFSSPWRGASTIAAVILLVLTLIQTIFSAMSVK